VTRVSVPRQLSIVSHVVPGELVEESPVTVR
jgi:hypothetical protein